MDDILQKTHPNVFFKKNFHNLNKISLEFVFDEPIDNKTALGQVMVWGLKGGKRLPDQMLTLFTDSQICITRPQWVDYNIISGKAGICPCSAP